MNNRFELSVYCARIFPIIATVALSCEPAHVVTLADHLEVPHRRALSENFERTAAGLRPVDSKWICFRSTASGDEWLDEHTSEPAAIKYLVRREDGSLQEEADCYFSGRFYKPEEGTPVPESLEVWFDYGTRAFVLTYAGSDPLVEKLVGDARNSYSVDGKLDLSQLIKQVQSLWKRVDERP